MRIKHFLEHARLSAKLDGRSNRGFSIISCWASVLALLFSVSGANAELIWTRTVHEAMAKKNETEEKASFSFKNKGNYPVSILKIQTSCGCTTTNLAKRLYQPGETGEIEVVFKFGDRKGSQEKSIIVQSDDKVHPRQILLMRVEILIDGHSTGQK